LYAYLPLLHGFQQCRLHLWWRPVYLIGQEDVGEGRAGAEFKFARLLIEDRNARNIGGEEVGGGEIVRVKRFELVPMTPSEAVEQMELLGHQFFVFFDADEGGVSVVYRRRDGNYGLIVPAVR